MASSRSDKRSKLHGISSKSTLIKKGPPAIYQMISKKQSLDGRRMEQSELKRWTIGENDHRKTNRTVLLLGETGTGKSTLINAMFNYVMGVEWEDQVWFEIIEEGKRRPSERKTSEVNVYDIFGFEDGSVPYSLTIIDTPGYGDKGIQEVIEKIQDLFVCTGIDQTDAVGLVMKATENQLSLRQKQIFDAVISLFGKDTENNIVGLFTHSDGGPATNALEALKTADIKCAKDEENQPVHFLFNNCQTVTITSEKHKRALKFAWETTMNGMKEFSEFLGQVGHRDLNMTANVLTYHKHREDAAPTSGDQWPMDPPGFFSKNIVKSAIERFQFKQKYRPDRTTTGKSTESQKSSSRINKPTSTEEREGNIGTSSKLQDTILRSTLIHAGTPKRYQLVPKKQCLDDKDEEESKLKRWTIGEKDHRKVNRTILLVGETGAGKTTMINSMVNYIMGVEQEDNIWFEITNEGNKCQTESQTSEVIAYDIFGFEGCRVPYSLTIIDTPGYGDTRGFQEDRLIAEGLHDLFRCPNGIDQINAVGFVVKASTNRLSDRQRYIFDAVLSLFGKDMENQIVALISNASGGQAKNALQALENIKSAKDHKNLPVHFLFNNQQTEVTTNKKEERAMDLAWEITKEGMHEFSEFLGKVAPQKLKMTVDVLTKRVQLEALVNNLQERIQMIEGKRVLLKQTQDELMKHKQEMDKNQNFVITLTERHKEREVIVGKWSKKAVCCLVCEENCHYPGCTIAKSPSWCEVMKNGFCTSCTGRCPVSNHVRENWKFVQKNKKITRTHDDLKKKYEDSLSAAGAKASLMTILEKELDDAVRDKARLIEESYQCVVKLEEIALRGNSLSTHVHLDFLIGKLKEKGEKEKSLKLESMQRCTEEGQKKGMEYIKTKLGTFWPNKL